MKFFTTVLAAAAALSASAPAMGSTLIAQDSGVYQRLTVAPGHNSVVEYYINGRGRMGFFVDTRAGAADSIGALVSAVTPGSPAALAGLRSGDLITAMNGARLVPDGRPYAPPGTPWVRLIEISARLKPGDTVNLVLRRGAEDRTVSLVADRAPAFAYGYALPEDSAVSALMGARRLLLPLMEARRPMVSRSFFRFGMGDLELAPINPKLGRYFGVSEGILVVQVPEDSRLNLEPGDVVLSVGDRSANSPSHLLRILRSYQGEETVRLEVMRMRKRITVTGRP